MHAQISGNGLSSVAWTTNNSLERDGVTVEQMDEWLGTPEAQVLPNWAWDIINAVMNHATNTEF